jgi:hypothetical protein
MGPTMRLRDIPTQTPLFSSCSGDSWNSWGLCAQLYCNRQMHRDFLITLYNMLPPLFNTRSAGKLKRVKGNVL